MTHPFHIQEYFFIIPYPIIFSNSTCKQNMLQYKTHTHMALFQVMLAFFIVLLRTCGQLYGSTCYRVSLVLDSSLLHLPIRHVYQIQAIIEVEHIMQILYLIQNIFICSQDCWDGASMIYHYKQNKLTMDKTWAFGTSINRAGFQVLLADARLRYSACVISAFAITWKQDGERQVYFC